MADLIGIFTNLVKTEEDEETNVSYGTFIDNLLAIALPHVFLFFNGANQHVERNASWCASYINAGSNRYHFMNTPLESDEGKIFSMQEILKPLVDIDVDVKIRVVVENERTHIYIHEIGVIVLLFEYFKLHYLPPDWEPIDVRRFLQSLAKFTQHTVEADLNDI